MRWGGEERVEGERVGEIMLGGCVGLRLMDVFGRGVVGGW